MFKFVDFDARASRISPENRGVPAEQKAKLGPAAPVKPAPSAKLTLDLEFSPAVVADMAARAGYDVYRPRPSAPPRDVHCSVDFELSQEGVRELARDAGLALEGRAAPVLLSAIANLSFTALLELRSVCDRFCTTGGLDDLLKEEQETRLRFLRSLGG